MKQVFLQKGETLIELLLYIGFLSMLLVVFLQVFTSVLDVQSESQSTSSVEQDGKYLIQRLTYDIQRSTSIQNPVSVGGSSSTLQLNIGGNIFTYTLLNNNLVLTNNLDTNAQLNSYDASVSALLFTRIGNPGGKNVIQVLFTLAGKTQRISSTEVRSFQTTIGTR